MLISNRSDFRPYTRNASVTIANRRVRTRMHGGVVGVAGQPPPLCHSNGVLGNYASEGQAGISRTGDPFTSSRTHCRTTLPPLRPSPRINTRWPCHGCQSYSTSRKVVLYRMVKFSFPMNLRAEPPTLKKHSKLAIHVFYCSPARESKTTGGFFSMLLLITTFRVPYIGQGWRPSGYRY